MSSSSPVKFGIVGLGGYGGTIARLLREQAASARRPVTLVAACDPDLTTHAKAASELRAAGVRVSDSLDAMLADDLEAVWLPVPIDLHRPFTEKALAAGKAVMCEKPAAGCVQDLDAMIAARDAAKLPVGIGFQDTHADTTSQIKRRLLDGELGDVKHATVYACWPRDDAYYARASWAGAMKRNGVWVLDSPANNAISHFIMWPLFVMGPTMGEAAVPQRIEAELYRARPGIECFDTISLRAHLPGGRTLLVLMTHGCQKTIGPIVTLHTQRATVTRTMGELTVRADGGEATTVPVGDKYADMVRRIAEAVRGQTDPQRPLVSLECARQQLVCVNAAVEATAIRTAPAVHTPRKVHAIDRIEEIFEACARENRMLHESGLAAWTHPAGELDVRDYRAFGGPHA